MKGRPQAPVIASLVAALGLAAALGSVPAQAGDRMQLSVTAVILPRIACSYADENGGQPQSRCSSSDPKTTYRVRRERDPRAGGPSPSRARAHANAVVLTVEP